MSEINIRADAVDVEQIMRQIRARIRDKRGVDYTEEQIQELARVRLEKFLDPKGVRSDLLEQFRRHAETERPPNYEFDDTALLSSQKPVVAFVRRLLLPVLKLFFSPNQLITALHLQSRINRHLLEHDALFYEVVHNLVVEMTRTSINVKNVQMRVESVSGRLDFNERRSRALEAVVQYRPDAAERSHNAPPPGPDIAPSGVDPITGGESLRSRRRRRRRGRRSGPGFGEGADEQRAPNSEFRPQNNEPRAQDHEPRAQSDQRRAQSDETPAQEGELRAQRTERPESEETRTQSHEAAESPAAARSVEPPGDSGSNVS
jgi:hypothetical protein